MPEINLVPMMDVLMTVLTFFIIISMTLTGQQTANISLPQTDGGGLGNQEVTKAKLVVGLNSQKQMVIGDQPVTPDQLADSMQSFLTQNPDGVVFLKADRQLNYIDVSNTLKLMQEIGGSQVSLAIDRKS